MKKKKTNLIFMIVMIVIVIGSLFVLNYLSNKQAESYLVDEQGNKEEVTIDYSDITEEIKVEGLDLANQPYLGDPKAPVKVVELGDYKCPACANWNGTVFPMLYEDYIATGKVQFYFVNFAFLAPDSLLAAVAGEAIYSQSPEAFWQFNTKLYKAQKPQNLTWATKTYLKEFVKENVDGIDYEQFNKDLDEEKHLYDAKRDFVMAEQLGVNSTPSIFVNGTQVTNNYQTIQPAIEAILNSGE